MSPAWVALVLLPVALLPVALGLMSFREGTTLRRGGETLVRAVTWLAGRWAVAAALGCLGIWVSGAHLQSLGALGAASGFLLLAGCLSGTFLLALVGLRRRRTSLAHVIGSSVLLLLCKELAQTTFRPSPSSNEARALAHPPKLRFPPVALRRSERRLLRRSRVLLEGVDLRR